MAFVPKDWQDSSATPLSAAALEDLEARLAAYAESLIPTEGLTTVGAKGVALHENFAGMTRPTGFTSVEWIGSVLPSNHEDGDTWVKVIDTPTAITLVAAGTFAEANNPATVAPALPAGVSAGDCMIAAVYTIRDSASFAFPAGWVEFIDSAGTGGTLAFAWRIYQPGDSAPTITPTGLSAADTVIAQIAAFAGVDDVDPLDTVGTASSNSSNQNIGPITGITPADDGAAVIVAGGKRLTFWTSVATLTGDGVTWGEIGEPSSTLGSDAGFVWDWGVLADAGAVTAKTFTVTGGASAVGRGIMFALSPEVTRTFGIEALQGEVIRVLDYDTNDFSQWPDIQVADPAYSATTVTTRRRHASGRASRWEVRAGDSPVSSGERAEVKTTSAGNEARYNAEGSEVWYGWSSYFPNNNPTGEFANFVVPDGSTNIFTQWHQGGGTAYGVPPVRFSILTPVTDPPHVGLKVRGGGTPPNTFNANTESKDWDLGAITYNEWWDFVFHVIWSTDELHGLVEVWMGAASGTLTKIVDNYTMATKTDDVLTGYLKQGFYRSDAAPTSVIYHDQTKIGRSFDAVDPRVA